MSAFTRAHADTLTTLFTRLASTHPDWHRAFVTVLQEADRYAAERVVGEDMPDALLRHQGAARQLRALLVLAAAPYTAARSEPRSQTKDAPQL